MSHKVSAYTIVELLIVLVLSSFVVSLASYTFYHARIYQQKLRDAVSGIHDSYETEYRTARELTLRNTKQGKDSLMSKSSVSVVLIEGALPIYYEYVDLTSSQFGQVIYKRRMSAMEVLSCEDCK